jgi:hypothetical protein
MKTTKTKTKRDWHVVGDICIDTGTLLLCDPCYAGDASEGWNSYLENMTDEGFSLPLGHDLGASKALTVMTGLGDGLYRVVARHEDVPGFGERVAEVRITFLPHPAFGYPTPAPGGEVEEGRAMKHFLSVAGVAETLGISKKQLLANWARDFAEQRAEAPTLIIGCQNIAPLLSGEPCTG